MSVFCFVLEEGPHVARPPSHFFFASINVTLVCPTRLPFITFEYFLPFRASFFRHFIFFLSSLSRFFFVVSRHFAFLFPPYSLAFHNSRSTLAFPHSWISKFILFSHISVSIIPPKVPFSFILISVLATHFLSNISFTFIQIQFILVPSLFNYYCSSPF